MLFFPCDKGLNIQYTDVNTFQIISKVSRTLESWRNNSSMNGHVTRQEIPYLHNSAIASTSKNPALCLVNSALAASKGSGADAALLLNFSDYSGLLWSHHPFQGLHFWLLRAVTSVHCALPAKFPGSFAPYKWFSGWPHCRTDSLWCSISSTQMLNECSR